MSKLTYFFKWLRCKLSGGHLYSGNYLTTTRNERDMTYIFRNRCLRCGKEYEIEVPMENLLPWSEFNKLPKDIKVAYGKAMR